MLKVCKDIDCHISKDESTKAMQDVFSEITSNYTQN